MSCTIAINMAEIAPEKLAAVAACIHIPFIRIVYSIVRMTNAAFATKRRSTSFFSLLSKADI